jgi:hypothetical protein
MRRFAQGLFVLIITAVLVVGVVAVYTDAYAACRMRPQCSTNADCDSICGPGLGRCVPGKCPIRVCRCG